MIKKILTRTLIISSLIIYLGCKKADHTAPVITLTGLNPLIVTLNTPYSEPGFSALDNKDGDISSKVRTSWAPAFDQNLAGTYILTYVVNDAAGNLDTAIRTVIVQNNAWFLGGEYLNVYDTCHFNGGPLTFNAAVTPSTTTNNDFTIGNFGGFGIALNAFYYPSNDSVSIPAGQSLGGSVTMLSSSVRITSNSNPTSMTIGFSWTDGHNKDTCSANYSK